MKRLVSIITAGAILLGLSSCMKEETRIVFDPSQCTAPILEAYEEVEGDVLVTFTPGYMNINEKIAYHSLAIVSLNGEPVSKLVNSSVSDNVIKVTSANLARTLIEMGCEDGSKVNFELVVRGSSLKNPENDQPTSFIDSQVHAIIEDYAVVLPSGDPYARYTDLSEWGLVGSITNWGNPADDGTVIPDVEMWTNGTLHVAKGVELKKGDEIKFRKNSSWDENLGYGEGVTGYELDMEFDLSQGGPNIVVAEDGVYDLILDPEAKTAKIITSVAPAPDPYAEYTEESEWGLVGSFSGWGSDPDVVMYTNGTLHVAKAVSLKAGDMVKFRKNSSWDENLGLVGPESSDWPMDEEFDLEAGGGNIIISEDGTYDLILNPEAKTAKIIKSVVPAGDPYASYTEESAWSLVGSFSGWGSDPDVVMYTNGTLHVAKAVALNKGVEVKFRKDNGWAVNFGLEGGASADWPFGEEFPVVQDGGNIIIQADGVFDFILDPDNATAKIINSIAPEAGDTPEPEPKPEVWSLIGTINGTGWDTDFDLTNTTGDVWEIKNVAFAGGELFKIRADHDWGKNYGGPEATIEIPKEDGSTEGAYEAEIGKAFTAGSVNIYIAEEGAYNITFTYGDEPTILIEEYKEFPDALYMVGTDFGNWNWSSDGVVELTPVLHNPDWGASAEGQWWTIRYLTAGNGVKFNGVRDWNGTQFGSLDTNEGFTNDGDGNVVVGTDGFYMIHIDLKRSILHIEPAKVYLIGETAGGAWDENIEDMLFETNADGPALVKELPGAGKLRMYAASAIATSPWWTREFTILDGKIEHRLMDELAWPSVQKGQKVSLDFNAGTGSITGEGEAPQYKEELFVPGGYSTWTPADAPKLMGKGDGIYKGALSMNSADGNVEFKFVHDGSWIGGTANAEATGVYTLGADGNMAITSGVYYWSVDLPNNSATATAITKVELMGSFEGGWENGIVLTYDASSATYTGSVTLSDNAEVKVRFNGDWGLTLAGTLDRLSAVADGNIAVAAGGTFSVSLDLNAGKLYLNN